MNEIEEDWEAIQKEVSDKVNQAVKLLQEAVDLARNKRLWSAFNGTKYPDLRDVVSEFFELTDNGWTCSFY